MRRLTLIFISLLLSLSAVAKPFELHRGINISHWLSQSGDRGEKRATKFTREDVKFLAESGYDHLRIPIDEEQMFDEQLNPEQEAFSLLHNAIGWCKEFDLKVIVDLHILRSHHFNAESKPLFTEAAAQEQFYDCWRKISAELKKYPRSLVAYELMNEPVADDPEQWNTIVNNCLKVVRELEPKRTIIIGSNRWQAYDQVKNLRVPEKEKDKNIIISFHFYNPFPLTHYRASWTEQKENPLKVYYPGYIVKKEDVEKLSPELQKRWGWLARSYNDINTLEKQILQALDAATAMGRKLYLGEFGCLHGAGKENLINWFRDVVSLCEKYDIGYASWDYKGGFGIIDKGQIQVEMLNILTGKE